MKKDMHIHSIWSDGELTETEVVDSVINAKLKRFAITDHDTIAGNLALFSNKILLEKLKQNKIQVVSGIEISSILNDTKMHILGYGFDIHSKKINLLANEITKARFEKKEKMVKFLKDKFNIELKSENLRELENKNTIGKPHIANILVKEGYALTINEAIEKYFKNFKHKESKVDVCRSIETIHKAGGIAVLAHPKEIMNDYNLKYQDINKLLKKLKLLGIDGIEVRHSLHNDKDIKKFKYFAKHYKLIQSEGSDFHGKKVKPGVLIGNFGYQPYKKNQ